MNSTYFIDGGNMSKNWESRIGCVRSNLRGDKDTLRRYPFPELEVVIRDH